MPVALLLQESFLSHFLKQATVKCDSLLCAHSTWCYFRWLCDWTWKILLMSLMSDSLSLYAFESSTFNTLLLSVHVLWSVRSGPLGSSVLICKAFKFSWNKHQNTAMLFVWQAISQTLKNERPPVWLVSRARPLNGRKHSHQYLLCVPSSQCVDWGERHAAACSKTLSHPPWLQQLECRQTDWTHTACFSSSWLPLLRGQGLLWMGEQ